jgi:hypothetical protein
MERDMSERKTFELPVSDCGCFTAGELPASAAAELLEAFEDNRAPPKYGVIVWYKDKETAKAACIAATKAHWTTP